MEWKILKEEPRVPRFLPLPVLLIGGGGGDVMFEFFYKSGNLSCLFVYLFVVVSFVPEEIH